MPVFGGQGGTRAPQVRVERSNSLPRANPLYKLGAYQDRLVPVARDGTGVVAETGLSRQARATPG